MPDFDASEALLEQVRQARENATPLRIQGANTKAFLGREEPEKYSTPAPIAASSATTRRNW